MPDVSPSAMQVSDVIVLSTSDLERTRRFVFLPTATDKMEDDLVLLFLFAEGCKLFCESLMCFTGGNVNGFRTSCNSIINKDLL